MNATALVLLPSSDVKVIEMEYLEGFNEKEINADLREIEKMLDDENNRTMGGVILSRQKSTIAIEEAETFPETYIDVPIVMLKCEDTGPHSATTFYSFLIGEVVEPSEGAAMYKRLVEFVEETANRDLSPRYRNFAGYED